MTRPKLADLLADAAQLPPSERLLLAIRLLQETRLELARQKPRRKWSAARGLIEYPALGEDAQLYLTRARQDEDRRRAHILRDGE